MALSKGLRPTKIIRVFECCARCRVITWPRPPVPPAKNHVFAPLLTSSWVSSPACTLTIAISKRWPLSSYRTLRCLLGSVPDSCKSCGGVKGLGVVTTSSMIRPCSRRKTRARPARACANASFSPSNPSAIYLTCKRDLGRAAIKFFIRLSTAKASVVPGSCAKNKIGSFSQPECCTISMIGCSRPRDA